MPSVDLSVRTALALVLALTVVLGTGVLWYTDGAVGAEPTRIDGCTTISEPGRYVLTADLLDRDASTCIGVRSSDVVLDGAGHQIGRAHV